MKFKNNFVITLFGVTGIFIYLYVQEITECSNRAYRNTLIGTDTLQDRGLNCTNIELCEGNTKPSRRFSNGQSQSFNVSNTTLVSKMSSTYMSERLNAVRDKCLNYSALSYWKTLGFGGSIWSYGDLNYCIVPKVGCTFWKRIMRFVSKDYPSKGNIHKPSDIDRAFVHYGAIKQIQQKSTKDPIIRTMVSNKAFMFSRDPYTRLWSAYIDKFLLPDFWRTDALAIIKKMRPNASQYELQCANNITFHEFLMFVNKTSKSAMNEHWERVHRLCSPCHTAFDVIGKLETFAEDSEYIMSKYNLRYLRENTTRLDMVTEEVKTLTTYNFKLENAIRKGCFDKMDVAERLWTTFQYNGYIHRDSIFPKAKLEASEFLSKPTTIFANLVLNIIQNQTDKGIETKSQKRAMMLEAYRKIPAELLASISEVYKYDFELFDYNKTVFT